MALKLTKPFPHQVIHNFISKQQANQLLKLLKQEKFKLLDSDLFTFWQTKELKNNKKFSPIIKLLQSNEWKKGLFAYKKINMFASLYQKTNHLLPHDDLLEGRKIAYILFLNDMSKGGALQLFKNNKVAVKIQPKQGSLALFEVSKKSIHSIQEVTSGQRWVITGWFHG
jgi:Rps23 Pro-64 3,4-dihydroxylase Tpa1-like proline 4-hydroxylase